MFASILSYSVCVPIKRIKIHCFSKLNFCFQSERISLNIKNYPIVFQNTCIGIGFLYIVRGFPIRIHCRILPCFQVLFRIRIFFPKLSQSAFRKNPFHLSEVITQIHKKFSNVELLILREIPITQSSSEISQGTQRTYSILKTGS